MQELRPGMTGRAEMVVGTSDTAPRVGSGSIPVLGTPVMAALMEAAAVDCVERHLVEGQASVGTHLDIRHLAATPVGRRVTAEAELVEVDGRTLVFAVRAHDEAGPIGQGRHTRVAVDRARFEAKLGARSG